MTKNDKGHILGNSSHSEDRRFYFLLSMTFTEEEGTLYKLDFS